MNTALRVMSSTRIYLGWGSGALDGAVLLLAAISRVPVSASKGLYSSLTSSCSASGSLCDWMTTPILFCFFWCFGRKFGMKARRPVVCEKGKRKM